MALEKTVEFYNGNCASFFRIKKSDDANDLQIDIETAIRDSDVDDTEILTFFIENAEDYKKVIFELNKMAKEVFPDLDE